MRHTHLIKTTGSTLKFSTFQKKPPYFRFFLALNLLLLSIPSFSASSLDELITQNNPLVLPAQLSGLTWTKQLPQEPQDVSILDQYWHSKKAANRIVALELIKNNPSEAVYNWLRKKVIRENDLDFIANIIEMSRKYSKQEANFWLNYYALSTIEDAYTCRNEADKDDAIYNLKQEFLELFRAVDVSKTALLTLSKEVISYSNSKPRPHWEKICTSGRKTSITSPKIRQELKARAQSDYPALISTFLD